MKVLTVLLLAVMAMAFSSLPGCGNKEPAMEMGRDNVPIEVLTAASNTSLAADEPMLAQEPPLPPQGPYKPTSKEIQTALKNAGYYTGAIDGKVGPMTKEAIVEFQRANELEPDGKVGLKTWSVLGKYLQKPSDAQTGQ